MGKGREAGGCRWAALALLCVAQFVNVLGVTVVIVALPSIGRSLGLSGAGLQWVAGAYALFFGGFLLLCGRAADLYGRRLFFVIGLAVFVVASPAASRVRCRCSSRRARRRGWGRRWCYRRRSRF